MSILTRAVLTLALATTVVAQPHRGDAAAAPAPACTSRQLTASYAGGDGAAGTIYGSIVLTHVSGRTCFVRGFGGLSYGSRGDGTEVGPAATRDRSAAVPVVILGPGDRVRSRVAEAQTANYDPADCQPVHVDGFRVTVPGSRSAQFVARPSTECSGDVPGHQLSHRAFR